MYTHTREVYTSGMPVNQAKKAIILLHGRGATASGILSMERHLNLTGMAIFAPQAANNSWYPYSFMAFEEKNQPALDSAIGIVDSIVKEINSHGIATEQIWIMGFSQGACLTLEYASRTAMRYGGIIAFTGGLIGEKLIREKYNGDFEGTPILITTGDPDPHVPVARVLESAAILNDLNAIVTTQVYKGRMHTISVEEVQLANDQILL